MNTPAHLIFGAAAFSRADRRWTLPAALLGALAPDLSLYLMVSWHLLILETDAQVVFDQLYFSDEWQAIFAIDNSIFVWAAVLALGYGRGSAPIMAFAGGALLHILLDLPLHAGDGRPHFWPLTMWVFDSPVSYWDNRFGARVIGAVELALSAAFVAILWRRYSSWPIRALFALLFAAQAMASGIWRFVF